MSHYIEYYNNQAGGGYIEKYNRFGKVYVGSYQHGHGIGAFLGGLFRRVVPFLGKAVRAVGKEALHAGMNVLSDVTTGQIPFKQSLEHRLTETGIRLKRKASEKLDKIMRGSGYKRQQIRKITHKASNRGRVRKRSSKKKITKKKKECAKSELDLFTLPPTQTSIEQSQWTYYNPMASLSDDAPIEFVVPEHSEEYIDLSHTMIKIKAKIVKPEGSVDEKDFVGPVNNFLHSMFNQVDVFFNQKTVSPPNNAYAYRAYLETILNYGVDAKSTHLKMGLWNMDTMGEFDNLKKTKNRGLEDRSTYTSKGKEFEMMGHLHCDIFNQDKFLLNGVEMRIRLIRSKNTFCLMNASENNYVVKILEAMLITRRVKINPSILIAHARTLGQTTAKYPLTRVEVKSFVLSQGILGNTIDNVVLGQLPKRIIIGFVDNRAYNGSKKHPFNFQTFSLNYLCLYIDGKQVLGRALQPHFGRDNYSEVEAFNTLFSGTGIHFGNTGPWISRMEYQYGYTFYAFDLTPDLSANLASHWNLVKNGSLRLEVRFAKALDVNVNCITYLEFDITFWKLIHRARL
ncbi:uncharacterized protein F54H12.2-like [Cotesia glomerata]|uniref:uncharacterized protein F54H12.2-like n=1 Tax=Cotesia glomerata TaxID=32391 RepID=UPI001D03182D|nr:uncharacterized protein F54H12.2-like [Cotesia glomerata]